MNVSQSITLTPRELEVLQLIAQGYFNKQIAAELKISPQTVKNHVSSILFKLNAYNRVHAVLLGKEASLI